MGGSPPRATGFYFLFGMVLHDGLAFNTELSSALFSKSYFPGSYIIEH